MEEVEGRQEQPRIKLFGKMIGVQGIKEEQKGEDLGVQADDEKIIPCPRCKSMDTKFCYFNNYNVNQPRHFCKGCQRYWTAGGALRNVPVGAGRRKAKPPSQESCTFENSSQVQFDHHLIISGALGHREDMVLQPSDSEGQLC